MSRLIKKTADDIVDNIYRINITGKGIYDLNNEFCKYYTATNIQTNEEFFAIVFNKYYNYSEQMFEAFNHKTLRGINPLVAYSIVRLSALNSRHLVAIVKKYNYSNTLSNYIETYGPLSVEQIKEELLPPILTILAHCEQHEIPVGNINPNNIIISDDKSYVLNNCITAYPHFYQDNAFLAPEIADCIPSGRYIPNITADIYALGMTILYALIGKKPWLDYDNDFHFNEERFEYTTFKCLVLHRKMPESLKIFFKGVLHDSAKARWKLENIFDWLSGKYSSQTTLKIVESTSSLLSFNGHNYGNLKSISHALYYNWDEAIKFFQDDRIMKWAGRNGVSNEIIEGIGELIKGYKNILNIGNISFEGSQRLTKLLSVIDPFGGIRLKGIAFSPYSISNVICYLFTHKKKIVIEQIFKALSEGLGQRKDIDADTSNKYDKITKFFSTTRISPINSIERIMYSLDPSIPCLSTMVINDHVTSIPELLTYLNKAAQKDLEKFNIDSHIISFIAAKIGIQDDSNIKILKNFPKFSNHTLIYGLSIIYIAHKHAEDVEISHLFNLLVQKLIEVFNQSLHNAAFKNQLQEKLTHLSKNGDLSQVIELLSDQTPFINDYNGYYDAFLKAKNIKKNIEFLTNDDTLYNHSLILGQKITVLFAYVLCLIVTIVLVL